MKTYFIGLALVFLSCFTYANIIYVDDSNTSGIENGTLQYPFNTVAEGIDAANAGDTVYIFAGVYPETGWQFLYLKDGLVITGEDSSSVIINTGFRNAEVTMINYTEVSNVKFTEFSTATGAGTATIVVKQCRFQIAGFSSGGGYTFIVENCTIDEGLDNASSECYMYIRNNTIINGRIDDRAGAPPGIEAHIIENNIIYNDGFSDPREAVITAASQSVTILNNVIVCEGQGSGIDVSSGAPTNIIGNSITLNNGVPLDETFGIETISGYGVVTDNIINGGWVGYHSSSGAVLFENNTITHAHYGFISVGNEEVKNNTIKNCRADGMVLKGLRGPISRNIIKDNDSAGIRLIYPVDIGGGNWNGEGGNIIQNNGFYDLVIDYIPQQPETLYVMYNAWDHETLSEILQYDIYNEGGSTNIIINANGFIIKPEPTTLISPPNGSTEIGINANLVWHTSERSEKYWLQIALDNNFTNAVLDTIVLTDTNFTAILNVNTIYYWRVAAGNPAGYSPWSDIWNFKTVITGVEDEEQVVSSFKLEQNYPNPFNPSTTIKFTISPARTKLYAGGDLRFTILKVYDVLGNEITTLINEELSAGEYKIEFNGNGLTSGIYFYQLRTGEFIQTKKMVLTK
jgi:hypothetical protein